MDSRGTALTPNASHSWHDNMQVQVERDGEGWATTVTDRFGVTLRWGSDVQPAQSHIRELVRVHRRYSAGTTARN